MSFISSASGRACFNDWDRPLAVSDILSLLLALKQAVAIAGSPVILIVAVRESVPAPATFLLNCIRGSLPAILDCCEQLALVIEGAGTEHDSLRAAFHTARRQEPTRRAQPKVFDTLSAAFTHVQSLAPNDVLELQRGVLRQSSPPEGR